MSKHLDVDPLKPFIIASQTRNCLPVLCFSLSNDEYITDCYFEYSNKIINFDAKRFLSLEKSVKLEIFKNLFQFICGTTEIIPRFINVNNTRIFFDQKGQIKFLPAYSVMKYKEFKDSITNMLLKTFSEHDCFIPVIIRRLIEDKAKM